MSRSKQQSYSSSQLLEKSNSSVVNDGRSIFAMFLAVLCVESYLETDTLK